MTSEIRELDEVKIPAHIAKENGVKINGTVVFFSLGADHAVVECQKLGTNEGGLLTELLELPVRDLIKSE